MMARQKGNDELKAEMTFALRRSTEFPTMNPIAFLALRLFQCVAKNHSVIKMVARRLNQDLPLIFN